MQPLAEPDEPERERHRHQQADRRAAIACAGSGGRPTGAETQRRAPADLFDERAARRRRRRRCGRRRFQKRAKKTTTPTASLKSDSPAIWTSSRFGARAVRSMPEDGNRIGRRDDGPEQQAFAEIDREAADARHQQRQPADDRRRDRDPDGRQHGDQGLFAEERGEVDLQRPGEEQE